MRGMLVTFEGVEGSGKTTQAARLVESLKREGMPVTSVREPGGTALGEKVREILLSAEHHDMAAWAEASLYTAARAQLLKEVIIPRLARGDIVVADRFVDSTFAYQGAGRGLEMNVLMAMQMVLKVKPDLTLHQPDRLEQEDISFHTRVRQGYLDFATRDPDRYHVIDASADSDSVAAEALSATLVRASAKGIRKAL
jgi:dTMP kinase